MAVIFKRGFRASYRRASMGMIVTLSPEILRVETQIEDTFTAEGVDLVFTSGVDGKHGYRSKHYRGDAVDVRSKHLRLLPTKLKVLNSIREILGTSYDVILEDEGQPNEHYHIEYDPKGRQQ